MSTNKAPPLKTQHIFSFAAPSHSVHNYQPTLTRLYSRAFSPACWRLEIIRRAHSAAV
jgi:hypothetical protein